MEENRRGSESERCVHTAGCPGAQCGKKEEQAPRDPTAYDDAAVERIGMLTAAIARRINDAPLTRESVKRVKLWAVELNQQLDLLATLLIYDA